MCNIEVEKNKNDDLLITRLENIFDMRNGFDVYQMLLWGNINNNDERTYAQELTYKSKRKLLKDRIFKLKLIRNLGAAQDMFHIKSVLFRVKLARMLFILDLE
jgi:hypothetical protein